ncbi:MAG: LrgB family protein [Alphaproteobacteria bacterium]
MSDLLALEWQRLAGSALLWLPATLAAYSLGLWLHARANAAPLANPLLIAIVLIGAVLLMTSTPYADYFASAQILHFLLGPATVALALPLWRHLDTIKRYFWPVMLSIAAGSVIAAGSAVAIAYALGASRATLLSLAPKSVTTPIAISLAEQIGGLPALAAVIVLLTGAVGAVLGRWLLNLLNVMDWRARGLAVGTVSHGIATARAFQVNETAGAFSGLAMGVNGLLTALTLPWLVKFFG